MTGTKFTGMKTNSEKQLNYRIDFNLEVMVRIYSLQSKKTRVRAKKRNRNGELRH